jgi:predicted MFS family arabinose efflux permease
LVITVGYGWCFTVDAISYLAVIAGLLMMRRSELCQPPLTPKAKGQVREGVRYVRETPDLWIPLVMTAVIGTLTFNFSVLMPLFAERTFHGSDAAYTTLFSVLSLGSVTAALVAAHRRSIDVHHVVMTALGFGVAMLIFASSPNLISAYPVALLVGFASVSYMTAATAIVQVRSDPAMRGRVLALQAMVIIGSTPIGGPLLGAISDTVGPRAGLVVGGLAALGAAAWGYHAGRSHTGPAVAQT